PRPRVLCGSATAPSSGRSPPASCRPQRRLPGEEETPQPPGAGALGRIGLPESGKPSAGAQAALTCRQKRTAEVCITPRAVDAKCGAPAMSSFYTPPGGTCDGSSVQAADLSRLPDYLGVADLLALDLEPGIAAAVLRRASSNAIHRAEVPDIIALLELEDGQG